MAGKGSGKLKGNNKNKTKVRSLKDDVRDTEATIARVTRERGGKLDQAALTAGVDAAQARADAQRIAEGAKKGPLGMATVGARTTQRTSEALRKMRANAEAMSTRKPTGTGKQAPKPRNRAEAARKAALTRKMRGGGGPGSK